jgi:hypothetical protein
MHHLIDLGEDVTVILEWMLHKGDMKMWNGFIWLRIGSSEGI